MKKCCIIGLLMISVVDAHCDEGMWLFNQPPRQILKARYQFDPSDAWLEHLQKSSVRFNSGGSGSFVNEDGLLISNHHVGADDLQKLSTSEKNYVRDGFHARTTTEERKCVDLELNVLQSIEDVTEKVNAAVPQNADPDAAFKARRKIIAEIEKQSLDQTGLRCDVVTLWKGGAYHLYRYKRYTDVRLVFAPEQQIAFYGGDPDNFEYPRYDLDICIFRVYENDRPVKLTNYLRFSAVGPRENDLVLVSGHPGGSSRLLTVPQLESERDNRVPFRLRFLKRREVLLANWSARSEENARRAREDLFRVQNSRKAYDGLLAGLLDPELMSKKIKAETEFKAKLRSSPDFAGALTAYDRIAEAEKINTEQLIPYSLLERGYGVQCDSFFIARDLLRAGEERPKPNGERLEEFTDARKSSLELDLFSEKPIYTDLEILLLTDALTLLASQRGGGDLLVKKVLAGKSPVDRATDLILKTKVREVAFRKSLYEGGASAVSAAKDPMIELAALIDSDARALRKVAEAQDEARKQAQAVISHARNKLLGTAGSPDATFTLRLAFGSVKGYEDKGAAVPAFTTFAGLYKKAGQMKNRPPFHLPLVWEKRKSHLNLNTPFNFVSTCDIIGGNSGSPVVNRAGEWVGIIFDGNLESLPWDYAFDDRKGRAVSVDSAAILQALENVYDAKAIAQELRTGRR